jgi:TorA maturation chaperone TorD
VRDLSTARDLARLLGGLLLEGARPGLLAEVAEHRTASRVGSALDGEMAAALGAFEEALVRGGILAAAVEYTRLTVVDGRGARRPVPVPLWEDVHLGPDRRVMGERCRMVREAYREAGLGYDGIGTVPADHIGLEFLFVAALLEEERQGRRDPAPRRAFVATHLEPCAAAVGQALQRAANGGVWGHLGQAVVRAPSVLAPWRDAGVPPPHADRSLHRAVQAAASEGVPTEVSHDGSKAVPDDRRCAPAGWRG